MKQYRFSILLATLMLLLLIFPFLDHFQLTGLTKLLQVFTTLILIASVHAVSENRRQVILAVLVIAPAIALGWGSELLQVRMSQVGAGIMQIIALGFIAYKILGYALRGGRVDHEKVAAAVCAYLLLGVVWADLFELVNILIPVSFNSTLLSAKDFLYYSFVTLSTLGYGDITPVKGPAQALAYTEALVGQLYLTVLVARLVGLYIAHSGPDGCNDS
ncbi:MAG: potassium channel family protein [Desulfobacterales bacterium]